MNPLNEKELWDQTSKMHLSFKLKWGQRGSSTVFDSPTSLGILLSRYKFTAKMACRKGGSVLELGCGEGIGATILAEQASAYVGIDRNEADLQAAAENLRDPLFHFIHEDYSLKKYGLFDAVVCLNAIHSVNVEMNLHTVLENLAEEGICVLGAYNKIDGEMRRYFHQVLLFGMTDEMVHSLTPTSDYILNIGFFKKS